MEQRKGKQPQQRSVGIAHEGVDDIDERGGVAKAEDENAKGKEQSHDEMCHLAQAFIVRTLADVYAERCGESRQRTVNGGERCGKDAYKEEYGNVLDGIAYKVMIGIVRYMPLELAARTIGYLQGKTKNKNNDV